PRFAAHHDGRVIAHALEVTIEDRSDQGRRLELKALILLESPPRSQAIGMHDQERMPRPGECKLADGLRSVPNNPVMGNHVAGLAVGHDRSHDVPDSGVADNLALEV